MAEIKKIIKEVEQKGLDDVEEGQVKVDKDMQVDNDVEEGQVKVDKDMQVDNDIEDYDITDILILFMNYLDNLLGVESNEDLDRRLINEIRKHNGLMKRITPSIGLTGILVLKYGKPLFNKIMSVIKPRDKKVRTEVKTDKINNIPDDIYHINE